MKVSKVVTALMERSGLGRAKRLRINGGLGAIKPP